jgi:hypothetical protein
MKMKEMLACILIPLTLLLLWNKFPRKQSHLLQYVSEKKSLILAYPRRQTDLTSIWSKEAGGL